MAYTFDFTGGSLPSGATVSRASSGTRFNASGVMETIGSNLPRFDYDPVALTLKGLLLEITSANLLLRSAELDSTSYWGKSNANVATNALMAPDGTVSAEKLFVDTTSNQHFIAQNQVATPAQLCLSAFLKASEYSFAALQTGGSAYAIFNLATGVVASRGGTTLGAGAIPFGNGWYRCWLSGNYVGVTSYIFVEQNNSLGSWTGDGTSGVYVWGVQLESGVSPSSYAPTVATTVTRVQESLVLNWGAQGVPDGICYARLTYDDLSTSIIAGAVVSGSQTISPASIVRPWVRKIDYILAPSPAANRSLNLLDSFA